MPADLDLSDFSEMLNAHRGGFNEHLGLVFTKANLDEIVAELEVGPEHLQPYGLVHGGVYSAMVETLASTGAAVNVMPQGLNAVGLDNHTSFLRAVRKGKLTGRATPNVRGQRTQVWSVVIRDEADRVVAEGRVRLLCLEQGAAVAGETVKMKTPGSGGA